MRTGPGRIPCRSPGPRTPGPRPRAESYERLRCDFPPRTGCAHLSSTPKDELVDVLRAVSEEPAAYTALRDAQTRWGAAQLGSLTTEARKNDLEGAPVTNASALGGYDAIAADVVRSKKASGASRWMDAVYTALRSPGASASMAPRSALPDRNAKSWRASLASVPAEERTDHLREQGTFMFTAWAEVAEAGRDRAEPVEVRCRRTGQERYGAIAQNLRMS
ncbi:hypothetical protein [Streptomyces sp. CB01580]|uniref:hypothetical protein n=1 Tax=Streptomyces sp. CB01580 TaxID=1703933 RepID=UPI0009398400|nr:hypothetical protein [Streptomyces sp. CB01580]OKJ25137.1 hypothetical protein AMK22_33450 [Streptomyces sp. CB01580]